jgi:DNA transformation protein
MAVSDSYLAFVLEQLEGVRGVVTKRMFGGVGIYGDGVFFALIDNDTLFFKVDDELRPQYRARRMPAWKPIPGKPASEGYYQVPPGVLEDSEQLAKWAKQSIAVPAKKPAKKKKKAVRTRAKGRR